MESKFHIPTCFSGDLFRWENVLDMLYEIVQGGEAYIFIINALLFHTLLFFKLAVNSFDPSHFLMTC